MTLAELLIASAICMTLMGAVLGMVSPLQRLFDTQPELADMHQRLRASIDAIAKDLAAAGPPVMPYRVGALRHDPAAGVFYRPDTISVVPMSWSEPAATSRTYYLRQDAGGTAHLMQYDGGESDLPLADHVIGLRFDYFGADALLPPAVFQDGPWFPNDTDANRFDGDLLKIRRIRVTVRVQASTPMLRRLIPDREIRFDVAPRNLGRE